MTTFGTCLREFILQYLPGDTHYDWVKLVLDVDSSDSQFEDYSFDDDSLLRYQNKIYVPNHEGLWKVILEEMHCTSFVGHPGVNKTMTNLRPLYFWSGLKWDVAEYVAQCYKCQHVKAEHVHPAGLLYPHEISQYKWKVINMDFVQGLPMIQCKHDVIVVVVDKLSKVSQFIPSSLKDGSPVLA